MSGDLGAAVGAPRRRRFGAETQVTGVAIAILVGVSTEPTRAPRDVERPVERTDPMLPVIVDGMSRPAGLAPLASPRVPTLDDASLAEMIAELDGADAVPSPRSAEDQPAHPRGLPHQPAMAVPDARRPDEPDEPDDVPARVVPAEVLAAHPLPAEPSVRYQPPPRDSIAVDRYVRRDYRPSPPPAEGLSLTGLSRRARGKLGSRLFAALFMAIFVLIVVQTVVSLLSAA